MEIYHGSVITVAYVKQTHDLIFKVNNRVFRQRLRNVNPEKRLYPAVSLKSAKVRIFKEEGGEMLADAAG